MIKKIKLTTFGIELASIHNHPDGCPILKAWRGSYSPKFVEAMRKDFEIVEDEDADGFLLPSNVSFYSPKRLKEIGEIVSARHLPSIGFDISHESYKPEWLDYIIRFSWYRHLSEPGAIISPAFLDSDGFDLREEFNISDWQPTIKESTPTVSFCGREGGDLGLLIWKMLPKNLTRQMSCSYFCSRTRGIRMTCCHPLRVDAMDVLEKDSRIKTDFVRRGKIGSHPKVQGNLRQRFFDNLNLNAYALCIRGTDNYSWRFYEALSLGKIPVMVDTECVLPLEDEIPWDDLIVRVPVNQLTALPDRLLEWHSKLSDSEFCQLQYRLRKTFERLAPINFYPGMLHKIFA